MELLGQIVAWAGAVVLLLCYPFTEFARGMATNPGMHKQSRVAMLLSAIGLVLILIFIF